MLLYNVMMLMQVTISDGGLPEALTSTVQVLVTIMDENDWSPEWPTQGLLKVPLLRYEKLAARSVVV